MMLVFKVSNCIYRVQLQVVANYYGNRKQYERVPGQDIYWAGGVVDPPPDTPQCGFDGSGCPPDGNYVSHDK